ncbi:hypothetical protein HMPREF9069_00567 [Atopobium sp. oral taxon 810 str. F0209]|nr:hypothetical protein HMPREF9069_00567 [Atopobium sp. oral taxon 810 str. F0209]
MQTVQNRTKPPKNAQVKIGARAHFEPDAGKKVLIEPSVRRAQSKGCNVNYLRGKVWIAY